MDTAVQVRQPWNKGLYSARTIGTSIDEIRISVSVALEGTPVRAVGAEMVVDVSMRDGSDPADLIARTKSMSMAINSLTSGLPVKVASRV